MSSLPSVGFGSRAESRERVSARPLAATDRGVILGLTAWTLVLAAASWGRWGDPTMDTGYDMLAASRIAHGDLPYADFTYYYGPLPAFVLGALYTVFGATVGVASALGICLGLAAIAGTYALARRIGDPLPAALGAGLVAAAAFSSANNSYVLPHSTSAPLAVVLTLGAMLLLVTREEVGSGRRMGAGVLCGACLLTRPEAGVPLLAAMALWIWLEPPGRSVRALAQALGPAIALPLVGYGVFLVSVSPGELLFDNLYPRDFMAAAGHVVLDSHAPWTLGSIATLIAKLALYAGAWLGVAAVAQALYERGRQTVLAGALIAVFTISAAVMLMRPETVRYYLQFAYAWVPAGAWVAVAVLVRRRLRGERDAADSAALLATTTLALATTTTYASFNPFPNALHPEATPYLLPLTAVLLVWVHFRALPSRFPAARVAGTAWLAILALASAILMVHDARQEGQAVRGPGGEITARASEAPALQGAVDAVLDHTQPGDQVLFAPQLTSLYILTQRSDPLPQLSLLPGALATPADEDQAIERMRDVDVVVTDRSPLDLYRHGAFGSTFDRRLAAWLQHDFDRTITTRGTGTSPLIIDTWIRRRP